jgi:hypothetical protein
MFDHSLSEALGDNCKTVIFDALKVGGDHHETYAMPLLFLYSSNLSRKRSMSFFCK